MSRRAVLVLGMHRSGTSALAGVLARLGAQPPRTLMEPNEYNPLGFWESSAFRELHDRLLRAGGSEWDLWTRFDLCGLETATSERLADEFQAVLNQEFHSAPLFVVKDPRICRFVPFWLQLLAAADVDPSAILIIRSPFEVAASLALRDGLGLEHALLLWLRHVLDAEFDTRSIRRSIVRYHDLLADWQTTAARISTDIGVTWPSPRSTTTRAKIAGFLKPELRHHAIVADTPPVARPLSEWVSQTVAALDLLADSSGDPACDAIQRLDEVRRAFDQSSCMFGPVIDEERRARRSQASALEADLKEVRRRMSDAESEYSRLRQYVSSVDSERQALETERERLTLELARTRTDLGSQLASLSQRLEASDSRVQALEHSLSWRCMAPLRAAVSAWQFVRSRVLP